jgi:hypothetical protein
VQPGRSPEAATRAGSVWRRADASVRGRAFVGIDDVDDRWLDWQGAGRFRFRIGHDRVDGWPAPDATAGDVVAAFEQAAGAIVFQGLGLGEALHASAAAGPAGAVVICGASGSGKSTLSFALGLERRWRQLADDHVLLSFDAARPAVLAERFEPSLRRPSRVHFGRFGRLRSTHAREPEVVAASAVPVGAIVVLEQACDLNGAWRVESVEGARAFTALLPHAHCFDVHDPGGVALLVKRYFDLIAAVPVFRIRYRPAFEDLSALAAMVAGLPIGGCAASTCA